MNIDDTLRWGCVLEGWRMRLDACDCTADLERVADPQL